MTPQKAIRIDLFSWSSAAIVSSSFEAAICMANGLSAFAGMADDWSRGREAPLGPQAVAIISQLEQFQTRLL
ncbi:MAG TPA: hypothetical protein VIZ19_20600 [Roseiarcus sp.]|jgi:hypothetical protein